MKRIYTYGHASELRNLTVADKIANKAAGRKMTQVTARNAAEAEIIADQGIDMIITGSDWFADVRRGAPNTFITAALFVASQCPGEGAWDINVHDYMTDGSGSGSVQLMLDLEDAQTLDVEREGDRWRVLRVR